MVYFQFLTRVHSDTLSSSASAPTLLIFASHLTKIGRRATHIMNISFKVSMLSNQFCFCHNRILASVLNHSSLMARNGTKSTATKAATMTSDTEKYFFQSRDIGSPVAWMRHPSKRQAIECVHFRLLQRQSWWQLD